jgi:hypothetical protein
VPVAVRGVAVLAESCIVAEPCGADPGEGQGRLKRDGDLPYPAGVYGVAAMPVPGGDALEDEEPSPWLTVQQEKILPSAIPMRPPGGDFSRRYQLDAGRGGLAYRP